MPDEQVPEFYRALLDAMGMPPMSGGSPEHTTPAEQDTPDAPDDGGSDEGTPAESQPDEWQERYEHLQPEYTRATQEAAQLRNVIELARQGDAEALEYLGWQAAEDESDDEEFDLDDDTPERLSAVEEYLAGQLEAQAQAEQEAQNEAVVDQSLEAQLAVIEQEYGQLADEDAAFLIQVALANPDEDGLPDLITAYAADADRLDAKRQEWVSSKRAPQAPSGASPSSQPNLDNDEERRDYMARRMAEQSL